MRSAPLPMVLAGLLALCVFVGSANTGHAAAPASELLMAKGLDAFHRGEVGEALRLFKSAAEGDPSDVFADYYVGVASGRLGDFETAVERLSEVVAARPDLEQPHLELGYALFRLGRLGEARESLQRAADATLTRGEAKFLLGMTDLRAGAPSSAEPAFLAAPTTDPHLSASSAFYAGVAAYRAGRSADAQRHFSSVLDSDASGGASAALRREASRYLKIMGAKENSPLTLYAATAIEYDSNPSRGPKDTDLAVELGLDDDDDGRAVLVAGGRYAFFRREGLTLDVGYEAFQSLHFTNESNNIQNHRILASSTFVSGPWTSGLAIHWDYYFNEDRSFLSEASVQPWLTYTMGNFGRSEVYYRFRDRDYHGKGFDLLAGENHAIGVRQIFYLDGVERYLAFSYRYDHEHVGPAANQRFAYDGHQIGTSLGWRLPWGVYLDASYAYRAEDYDDASERIGLSDSRNDDEHHGLLELRREVSDGVWLLAGTRGHINESDDPIYDYDRIVTTLGLEVRR